MRRALLALVFVVGLIPLGASNAASQTLQPDSCRMDGPLVVDGTLTIRNLADFGTDGHVWALDDLTEHVQVWQIGPKLYCVRREATGTWTSFGGASPAGTGTISAGLTGTAHGVRYLKVSGRFTPSYPTNGFIGAFDAMCQQDGSCTGLEPRMGTLYFSRVNHLDFGWYDFVATSDGHGTWHQSPDGDTGDILS